MTTPRLRVSSDQRNTWAPILYLILYNMHILTLTRLRILWTLHLSNAIRSYHVLPRLQVCHTQLEGIERVQALADLSRSGYVRAIVS